MSLAGEDIAGLAVFKVFRDGGTRIDTVDDLLGWGVKFPNGTCVVDWKRTAFPEHQRLDHPHISQYGSLADVEQGTGGTAEVVIARDGEGWSE